MSTKRRRPPPRRRSESKELTRQALLRATLKLLSRNSFDSISLREVTRKAGVTPTAFYRHFDDMEELGLELVDESFGSLHALMREARSDPTFITGAVDRSVDLVVDAVGQHELHFRFIARERYGGVKRIRKAIKRQLQLFADELAVDLAGFPFVADWPAEDRRRLASLIAETMIRMAAELLDASEAERNSIIDQARWQLYLINVGVPAWSEIGGDRRAIDENARAALADDGDGDGGEPA